MTMTKGKGLYWSAGSLLAICMLSQVGCAVPQPPGHGRCTRLVEPRTSTGYWLYLPEDYVKNQGRHPDGCRWPLVVTFHGLRPYDNANMQIREWQTEADRYNFIVIAPELRTCDSLYMQFPLQNPNLPYVVKDEEAILAIMDEVIRRTDADPARVLATSFSSGGYIAHFMVNRHPERFSCLAVRGSNFNENLLNPAQVPKYRDMKIGIYFGENDIRVCADESMRAIEWYRMRRFDVSAKKVGGLGHQRRPEVAAAFFASTIGVNPKTPPDLGLVVMKDVGPEPNLHYPLHREPPMLPRTPAPQPETPVSARSAVFSPSPPQHTVPTPVATAAPSAPKPALQAVPSSPRTPAVARITPRRSQTPKRPTVPRESELGKPAPRVPERSKPPLVFSHREQVDYAPLPATIRVHGESTGVAPLRANLTLELPDNLKQGTSVLWTDNGRPISALNRFEAQLVLKQPGPHQIAAHIITSDDRQAIAERMLTVVSATTQPE